MSVQKFREFDDDSYDELSVYESLSNVEALPGTFATIKSQTWDFIWRKYRPLLRGLLRRKETRKLESCWKVSQEIIENIALGKLDLVPVRKKKFRKFRCSKALQRKNEEELLAAKERYVQLREEVYNIGKMPQDSGRRQFNACNYIGFTERFTEEIGQKKNVINIPNVDKTVGKVRCNRAVQRTYSFRTFERKDFRLAEADNNENEICTMKLFGCVEA